ncbi:hypothetical protein ACFOU2_12220, partial [Bacillus songklensis]
PFNDPLTEAKSASLSGVPTPYKAKRAHSAFPFCLVSQAMLYGHFTTSHEVKKRLLVGGSRVL